MSNFDEEGRCKSLRLSHDLAKVGAADAATSETTNKMEPAEEANYGFEPMEERPGFPPEEPVWSIRWD